jgi:hypothetical protein
MFPGCDAPSDLDRADLILICEYLTQISQYNQTIFRLLLMESASLEFALFQRRSWRDLRRRHRHSDLTRIMSALDIKPNILVLQSPFALR